MVETVVPFVLAGVGWAIAILLGLKNIYLTKKNHYYESYKFCHVQAQAVKSDYLNYKEVLNQALAASSGKFRCGLYHLARGKLDPKVFMAVCSHFYRFETIWVTQREKRLPDNMWHSLCREIELYLDAPAYWYAFFNHGVRHTGLLPDFTKAIAYWYLCREKDTSAPAFPDPLHYTKQFKRWELPTDLPTGEQALKIRGDT